jgi:hypothetical protein
VLKHFLFIIERIGVTYAFLIMAKALYWDHVPVGTLFGGGRGVDFFL